MASERKAGLIISPIISQARVPRDNRSQRSFGIAKCGAWMLKPVTAVVA